MRPFEGADLNTAGQPRQGRLQRIARRDVEQRQPAAQAATEPARQPLLAAEIDDMQLAARLRARRTDWASAFSQSGIIDSV